MNCQLLIPLLVSALIAIIGWLVAHRLAAARDRSSKRKQQRVRYLIEAFRRLARVGSCLGSSDLADELQQLQLAIADIQLFGTPEQIGKVQAVTKGMAEADSVPLDDLLADLRTDLRKELHLSEVQGKMWWLKVERE